MNLIESRFGAAWRDVKLSAQEVPQRALALDEMPIGTAGDEHQAITLTSASDDMNASSHLAFPPATSNASSLFTFAQRARMTPRMSRECSSGKMLFCRAFPLHSYLYVMANDLHKRPFGLLEELIATSRHARNRVHALYATKPT